MDEDKNKKVHLEPAAKDIGLYLNANKIRFRVFKGGGGSLFKWQASKISQQVRISQQQ